MASARFLLGAAEAFHRNQREVLREMGPNTHPRFGLLSNQRKKCPLGFLHKQVRHVQTKSAPGSGHETRSATSMARSRYLPEDLGEPQGSSKGWWSCTLPPTDFISGKLPGDPKKHESLFEGSPVTSPALVRSLLFICMAEKIYGMGESKEAPVKILRHEFVLASRHLSTCCGLFAAVESRSRTGGLPQGIPKMNLLTR